MILFNNIVDHRLLILSWSSYIYIVNAILGDPVTFMAANYKRQCLKDKIHFRGKINVFINLNQVLNTNMDRVHL